jgi:hypothetical protein
VSVVGIGTTASIPLGVAIGLYVPVSKRVLACILDFAAGALISALAIELAFKGRSTFTVLASARARPGGSWAAVSSLEPFCTTH